MHLYGEAARFFFFFPPPKALLEQVHLYGEATRMYWGTLYSLVCCMTNVDPSEIKSNKGWQVHLYGEAARCTLLLPPLVGLHGSR